MLLKFRCQLTASVKLKLNLEKCTRSPAREQAPSGGGIMSYFAFVGFRLCVLSIVCWSDTSQTVETHLQTCGRLRGMVYNRHMAPPSPDAPSPWVCYSVVWYCMVVMVWYGCLLYMGALYRWVRSTHL